jgi:hypothetical protein
MEGVNMNYAAELDENDQVVRVIVGTAEWAVEHLGGEWVDPPELVGIGWELVDGVMRPPAPDPSFTWDGTAWQAPDGWEWPTMPGNDPLQYNVI